MAIFEVVLAGRLFEQQTVSRWNYVSSGTPAAVSLSFALASALGAIFDTTAIPPNYPEGTMLWEISQLCSADWVWEQITVLDVFSAVDFYQTPFVQPFGGAQALSASSPYIAFGFRTNQVRRDVARGTKRLAGVPEEYMAIGGAITGAAVAQMLVVAEAMSDTLTYDDEGNVLSFAPAICGKQRYDPETGLPSPTGTAYRYYADAAAQLAHTALSVTWQGYPQVRSQVSRQYGHGR